MRTPYTHTLTLTHTHARTHAHTHTQSLFQLLEPKVVVQCRKCDLTVVKVSFGLR